MANLICLSDLPEGRTAIIREIDSTSPVARRLMDLGFIPGTSIRSVKKAPLGEPTTFEIKGYQMGLRRAESAIINVEE